MWLVSAWPVGGNLPFQLKPGEYIVGRSKEHPIIIFDSSISRTHARLLVSQRGDVTIEDLGSRNGIDVNGKLTRFGCLKLNDRIRLGAVPCLMTQEPIVRSFSLADQSTKVDLASERDEMPDSVKLSPPQREVLSLIATGMTEEEVAGRTGRSFHTVHNHLRAIYRAYSVHSRNALMRRLNLGVTADDDTSTDVLPAQPK